MQVQPRIKPVQRRINKRRSEFPGIGNLLLVQPFGQGFLLITANERIESGRLVQTARRVLLSGHEMLPIIRFEGPSKLANKRLEGADRLMELSRRASRRRCRVV